MARLTDVDTDLLLRIKNAKSRGEDPAEFNEIESKVFSRLCSIGLAEIINGYAFVTDKGIKKLKSKKNMICYTMISGILGMIQ